VWGVLWVMGQARRGVDGGAIALKMAITKGVSKKIG
jgi:hypothetical protein